jgi:hypothetical protein
LPRKVFTAGEVLQAADVNDLLMDQSVMVFAGTAARGSAIPSPSEGMVTYREDANTVEVYNGSAFVPVGSDPGLVEVKSALFTGTQTASVASQANVAVTDLSITHEVADASNKLIISAFLGAAGHSGGQGNVGLAIHDGTSLIAIGDASGTKTQVTAGGIIDGAGSVYDVTMPSVTFVHTPGAGSKTYTVRAINMDDTTETLYINRSVNDSDQFSPRAVSSIVIQEVSV